MTLLTIRVNVVAKGSDKSVKLDLRNNFLKITNRTNNLDHANIERGLHEYMYVVFNKILNKF